MEEIDEFTKYRYSIGYYNPKKTDREAIKSDWVKIGNYFRNIL